MRTMRRAERRVADEAGIRAILDRCQVCRLALWDEVGPYIVPMSYGYRWDVGGLKLYFHCAAEGRKLDALRRDPRAAFEMDADYEVIGSESACDYTCAYMSVTGAGMLRVVERPQEACEALTCLMRRQTGMDFSFTPAMLGGVCVLCLDVQSVCGKCNGPA